MARCGPAGHSIDELTNSMHQVLLRSTQAAQSRVVTADGTHLSPEHSRRKSQRATAFDVIARRTLRTSFEIGSCAFQPQARAVVPPLASICHSPRCSSCLLPQNRSTALLGRHATCSTCLAMRGRKVVYLNCRSVRPLTRESPVLHEAWSRLRLAR